MKKLIRILFVIIALFIVLVILLPLGYNNADKVTVNYLTFSYETHLSWLMIGLFLFGAVPSLFFFALIGLRWKFKAKSLNRKVDELLKQRQREAIAEQFKAEQKISKNENPA